MKKADLVEAMLAQDEIDKQNESTAAATDIKKTDRAEHVDKEDKAQKADRADIPMDNLIPASGILEVMGDGFGFIRCDNYMPGTDDVYVSQSQIKKFNLKTGDIVVGKKRFNNPTDKFAALMIIDTIMFI